MRTCLKPDPSGARLTLDPAQGSDTATYKCRVDFEMSSTRSTLVTLTVYVVPSCLVLLDTGWSPVHGGVLRSLIEGDPLTLQCTASGEGESGSVSRFNTEYRRGGFALIFIAEYSKNSFYKSFFRYCVFGKKTLQENIYLKSIFLAFIFV
ncbi:uncharacterized protein LOC135097952 isoform X2 [Scylla paramamosain]|uniref:uncharacterized protein LOC135097952 isoform X2 n=1 Tax=Scylla paramamosain TaxID=85552 RepID=UPI003083DECE